MQLRPDHRLDKAARLLRELDAGQESTLTLEEQNQLLIYYIKHLKGVIGKRDERIKEMQSIFDAMGKFIPSKGPTVYR